MRKTLIRATVVVLVVGSVMLAKTAGSAEKPAPRERRHVDLVICLDTSGSMTKLIEAAKQKLWSVVNELATAKPKPVLRVGLYQYGNDGLSRENGWVERLCPLTDDLDEVYGKLFALRTNGGTEYVARVIRAATNELKWNMDKGTLRMIFVAGNEPATQDEKTYKLQDICKAAVTKGIIVNTIFCNDEATGRRTGWADAAAWADGKYAAINRRVGTVVISTPYDKKLAELLNELDALPGVDLMAFTALDEEQILDFIHGPDGSGGEGLTDPDAVPENVKTRCKAGDLWQLGEHRLLCGDSTKKEDVMRLMAGEKADMVFTDPPYNVDYGNIKHLSSRKGILRTIICLKRTSESSAVRLFHASKTSAVGAFTCLALPALTEELCLWR